jgi:hypothetical protein
MVIPMYYSISYSNNSDLKTFTNVSGSISATTAHALEDDGCNNGGINLEIENSNDPFYIEWSNGETSQIIEDLIPGEYCVTVTDDSCGEAIGCWEIKCCPFILDDNQIQYNINNPGCEGQKGELELYLSGVDEDEYPLSLYLENSTDDTKYDFSISSNNSTIIKLTKGNYTAQLNYGEGCSNNFDFAIIFQPIEIQFDKTPSCNNDGTINTLASFGKYPYSYSWSDDENNTSNYRTNLSSGLYTVTVTDVNLCSVYASVYIKSSDLIITDNMSVFIGPSDCFENTGILEVSKGPDGGTPPFTYEWSNGESGKLIENLEGGDYQLTMIDELGCTATITFTVTVTGQPIINNSEITNTCADQNTGEIGVLASSTVGGELDFLWSNGSSDFLIDSLSSGSYTITITDQLNNCTLVKTYEVVDFSSDPIVIEAAVKNNCESSGNGNGEISLDISGGIKPYDIVWNNGATNFTIKNLESGEYSATITDKCGSTEFYSYNLKSLQLEVNIDVIYPNFEEKILEAKVSGGTSPYDYIWNTGAESSFIVETDDGTYSVTVTDQNGCIKSETIDVICEPSPFTFVANDLCAAPFKVKVGTDQGVGPGPFLLKIEKKVNQKFEVVDFIQFPNPQQLSAYTYEDADAGFFKVSVTNHCGQTTTKIFDGCVDCDFYFYNQDENYFASVMGDLLIFELVCPCENDCGFLDLITDKVKLKLNQAAIKALNDNNLGFATFEVTWPDDVSNIYHSVNQNKYIIDGPSKYTLTDDDFENGITVSVSLTLPFGLGEVCNLTIPFEFGQEGVNGYFKKWVNPGANPFVNHIPPYNWATQVCPYQCTIPLVDGVLYENEPIDEVDELENYASKCATIPAESIEYLFYQPNDYTKPCAGGGSLLTHYESIVGVISGQKTILPNVAIDAHPYWPLAMLEENDPTFPYKCPPHIYEKGYCLFDSRDVYGDDVILRDPIIASYCKDRFFDPPVDTDGDGLPDVVDPCPLNPDLFCTDGNTGDGTIGGGLGGGGGTTDENGCQTTFLPNECSLAIVCPEGGITIIEGVITTESYSGSTPCIHCFSAEICRVTNPETQEEHASIIGPVTGSVSVTQVDIPECGTICGTRFSCTTTGEVIVDICSPNCHTSSDLVCSNIALVNIIELLQEEGAPESIELEMDPELLLQIINSNRQPSLDYKSEEKLITIPNPSKKEFIVQFDAPNDFSSDLQIRNTYNQVVLSTEIIGAKGINKFNINNDFPPGLYIISIKINDDIISTKHIIIN